MNISDNWIPDKQAQEIDKLVRRNRLRPIMQGREKSLLELDLSSRFLDHKDASVVAVYIENNGALETIKFGDKEAVTMNADVTEADFNGKRLGTSGAMILAAFLPKCR